MIRLILVSGALMVAGCAAGPAADGVDRLDADLDAVSSAAPRTTSIEFHSTAINTDLARTGDGQPWGGEVVVAPNATVLLLEIEWSCLVPGCTVDLVSRFRGEVRNVTVGEGGKAAASLPHPEAGEWLIHVWPRVAGRAWGEIRATVFEGDPPAGFTAFP